MQSIRASVTREQLWSCDSSFRNVHGLLTRADVLMHGLTRPVLTDDIQCPVFFS